MIEIRLRRPLELKTRDERLLEAATGWTLPGYRLPARTTLAVVDLFQDWALCVAPDGRRLRVSREALRESGYRPRAA